jgi:hypothetical protein
MRDRARQNASGFYGIVCFGFGVGKQQAQDGS